MNKIFTIFIMSFFVIQNSFATYSGDSGYKTINEDNLNFQAILENGIVKTSWDIFTKSGDYGFSYYKVIRSNTKSNPYYPEDGYISYISDITNTNYTDNEPYFGGSYYRVCAIAHDKGNYRFCSKVIYVNNTGTKVIKENKEQVFQNTAIKYNLKLDIKIKLNNLFAKYKTKIESKTQENNKRLEIVNAIIEKLNTMQESDIINYLLEKFNDYKNELSSDITNIDDAINNIIDN